MYVVGVLQVTLAAWCCSLAGPSRLLRAVVDVGPQIDRDRSVVLCLRHMHVEQGDCASAHVLCTVLRGVALQ